jgi:hypothetical protein
VADIATGTLPPAVEERLADPEAWSRRRLRAHR